MRMLRRTPSPMTLKLLMKPSSFKMRAISSLMFETGTSTFWCLAAYALRMRVSISAIGSVITSPESVTSDQLPVASELQLRTDNWSLATRYLPTRLRHAGNVAFERQPAEADAAERELAQIAFAASATPAAVMHPRRKD